MDISKRCDERWLGDTCDCEFCSRVVSSNPVDVIKTRFMNMKVAKGVELPYKGAVDRQGVENLVIIGSGLAGVHNSNLCSPCQFEACSVQGISSCSISRLRILVTFKLSSLQCEFLAPEINDQKLKDSADCNDSQDCNDSVDLQVCFDFASSNYLARLKVAPLSS
ncbi:hypothetical protein Tco_0190406 [Tanacetum coccineum]